MGWNFEINVIRTRRSVAREAVDVSLVDPVRPGDLVLVHAGVAITVVSEVSG